jgi:dTDP-4-amino-4,6-dideoxygalactose transaminase
LRPLKVHEFVAVDRVDGRRVDVRVARAARASDSVYLLLATIRLVYRVTEVPVTKIYPKGGKAYSKTKAFDWWNMAKPCAVSDADRVPFVDLRTQTRSLRAEVEAAWAGCLERCDFVLGEETARFEEEFASFLGVRYVIGVGSGLEALTLALDGLGVGPGDVCVVPANTFVATPLAASRLGARVAWCDVDPVTRVVSAATLERALAALPPAVRPAAVLAVHLCGRAVPTEVFELCAARGIPVVEDAAQSHGARFADGSITGTRGRLGCFSFYPGKNLGAWGDGGAIATGDDELAARARRARNYGQRVKYEHIELGTNSRLDTLQAAVLRVKLRRLPEWNRAREAAAGRYERLLAETVPEAGRPAPAPPGQHVWHLYRIECRDPEHRARVAAGLRERGIETGVHYPIPCHLQACYAGSGSSLPDLSVSEAEARRTLSLPIFPEITPAQQQRVAEALRAVW